MQLQKTFVVGNLARNPQYSPGLNGKQSRCSFRVLVTNRWGSSEDEKHTEGFNVVTFGTQADNCGKYLEKGQEAGVEGEHRTRSYTDGNDVKYITELVANRVQFGRKSQAEQTEAVEDVDESSIPDMG